MGYPRGLHHLRRCFPDHLLSWRDEFKISFLSSKTACILYRLAVNTWLGGSPKEKANRKRINHRNPTSERCDFRHSAYQCGL